MGSSDPALGYTCTYVIHRQHTAGFIRSPKKSTAWLQVVLILEHVGITLVVPSEVQ